MDDVYVRYVGDGRFIFGVPAKDLSRAEFEALSEDMQANVLASGLYELIDKPQPKKKAVANPARSSATNETSGVKESHA